MAYNENQWRERWMKDLNWRINSFIKIYKITNNPGLKKLFPCIADILNYTIATHL